MKKNIKNYLIISLLLTSFSVIANPAKDIFDRYCTVCHSPSMAPMFGSPAAHDIQAWNERKQIAFDRVVEQNSSAVNLSNDEKNSYIIQNLVDSAKNGTDKGMPPMGTCMECSDNDLKLVIEFMSAP